MSVTGEWTRHLEQLIELIDASQQPDRDTLGEQLREARPANSLELSESAHRVQDILTHSKLAQLRSEKIASASDRNLIEELDVVQRLAQIINGD